MFGVFLETLIDTVSTVLFELNPTFLAKLPPCEES